MLAAKVRPLVRAFGSKSAMLSRSCIQLFSMFAARRKPVQRSTHWTWQQHNHSSTETPVGRTSIARLVEVPGGSGMLTDASWLVAITVPSRLVRHSNQATQKSTALGPTFETQKAT